MSEDFSKVPKHLGQSRTSPCWKQGVTSVSFFTILYIFVSEIHSGGSQSLLIKPNRSGSCPIVLIPTGYIFVELIYSHSRLFTISKPPEYLYNLKIKRWSRRMHASLTYILSWDRENQEVMSIHPMSTTISRKRRRSQAHGGPGWRVKSNSF